MSKFASLIDCSLSSPRLASANNVSVLLNLRSFSKELSSIRRGCEAGLGHFKSDDVQKKHAWDKMVCEFRFIEFRFRILGLGKLMGKFWILSFFFSLPFPVHISPLLSCLFPLSLSISPSLSPSLSHSLPPCLSRRAAPTTALTCMQLIKSVTSLLICFAWKESMKLNSTDGHDCWCPRLPASSAL